MEFGLYPTTVILVMSFLRYWKLLRLSNGSCGKSGAKKVRNGNGHFKCFLYKNKKVPIQSPSNLLPDSGL